MAWFDTFTCVCLYSCGLCEICAESAAGSRFLRNTTSVIKHASCKLSAFAWDHSQFPVSATWCRCCHRVWWLTVPLISQDAFGPIIGRLTDDHPASVSSMVLYNILVLILMSDALLSNQDSEKKTPHTCICGMWNRLTRETNHMKEIKRINKSLFTCEAPTATSLDLRCNSSLGLPSQLTRSSHIKGKWNGKWARQLREAGRENKKKKMGSNLKAF